MNVDVGVIVGVLVIVSVEVSVGVKVIVEVKVLVRVKVAVGGAAEAVVIAPISRKKKKIMKIFIRRFGKTTPTEESNG